MVLLHVKKSDSDQFIVQASLNEETAVIIQEVIEGNCNIVHNLRLRVDKACGFIEELVKHGPLKDEEKRGLTEGEENIPCPMDGHRRVIDPNHYRTGWCVPEELGNRIFETTQSTRQLIHKSNADRRITISVNQLKDALLLMKGAVNMAYPGYHSLPPWEPSMLILENDDFKDLLSGEDYFDPDSLLWFAGKEIHRGKLLGYYIKGNENTKIIVKLTKATSGAPVREPNIDSETHKQMIAWYHKKEEESKKILAVDDDQYLNSPWANPKALKNQLHGSRDVKFRPF
jgi:cilia- and flagella-associated protein 298